MVRYFGVLSGAYVCASVVGGAGRESTNGGCTPRSTAGGDNTTARACDTTARAAGGTFSCARPGVRRIAKSFSRSHYWNVTGGDQQPARLGRPADRRSRIQGSGQFTTGTAAGDAGAAAAPSAARRRCSGESAETV